MKNIAFVFTLTLILVLAVVLESFEPLAQEKLTPASPGKDQSVTVTAYGASGDGETDDTEAIQKAINSRHGGIRFPKGRYRISKTILIDLEKTGYTSLHGEGVAQIIMAGSGPAFRFVGTHQGTAAPHTVKENVWKNQRTPMVDGLEIIGAHPEASGIEAIGTMQLTLTRLVVRDALHGVRLIKRNRNVILSECHLYHNRGIGLFLDHLNLHQINVANCHISYNAGGGIVSRHSEVRNLQIGTCDIEGNMGGPDSSPTANIDLDARETSLGEVAIVGCTIQHSHNAPESANIRINCFSTVRSGTDEQRHGNITIADNVLSDVQTNIEIKYARAVTITGNTIWKGYSRDVTIDQCKNVVMANNVFDRNPRYHYGDGSISHQGVAFTNCSGCTISANHIDGVGKIPASMALRNCDRMNITNCTILNYGQCGLLLENVTNSRVSDCLVNNGKTAGGIDIKVVGGSGNQIIDNLAKIAE